MNVIRWSTANYIVGVDFTASSDSTTTSSAAWHINSDTTTMSSARWPTSPPPVPVEEDKKRWKDEVRDWVAKVREEKGDT